MEILDGLLVNTFLNYFRLMIWEEKAESKKMGNKGKEQLN